MKIKKDKIKKSLVKTGLSFLDMLPMLISILLLVSAFITLVPLKIYAGLFTKRPLFDSFLGAILGSVSTGNPITSYIIGGELLKSGIGLIAVTSFILAWVSVGVIQLPAEMYFLGKRFAILRNLFSFISAIVIAILVVLTLRIL